MKTTSHRETMKNILLLSTITFLVSCDQNPQKNTTDKASEQKSEASTAVGDFYVSPKGNDSASGAIDAPFATLARARDAVRELKTHKKSDIRVYLREGHYKINKTIVFSPKDSGNNNQTITYSAYPGEIPTLSAGIQVTNWSRPSSKVPNLPEASQDKVMVANIGENFRTLYDSEGILQRAKSNLFITEEGGGKNGLIVPKEDFKKWANPTQLEFAVRPHHAWIVNMLPVSSIDIAKRLLKTQTPATYATNKLHFLKTVENAWVENAIEELDEPGEWVINTNDNKVYLWPRNKSSIYRGNLNEIIRIEGKIDYDGPTDTPVTNIVFTGLTFKHGERYQILEKDRGVQHDWNFIDKDNALVRLRGSEKCEISNCHFLHSGSGAIRVDLHGLENKIIGNHIEHIGGSGIFLCGYGPGTKDVNRKNFISNNHIHNIGEIYWHSPGIHLSQSGENQVSNNLIHHTNYTGLIISGVVLDFFRRVGRESSQTVRWHEIGGRKRYLHSGCWFWKCDSSQLRSRLNHPDAYAMRNPY